MLRFALLLSKQYPQRESARERFLGHLEQVRLAREVGFDTIVLGQHFLSSPFQELQSVPLLARVAAESGEMRLGLTILLTALLPPVEVAEMAATLDVISGGRFIFGAGLGYRQVEYDAFGVPPGEHVRRFEENLEVITRLWTEERVTYHGAHCRLDGASLTLRPLQKPRPPVWLAANNDPAVRRAARVSDAWVINPHGHLPAISRQLGIYRAELAACGKPFPDDLPLMRELYIAPQHAQAFAEVAPYITTKYDAYRQWGQQRALPRDDAWAAEFAELLRDRFVIGDPVAVREDLQRYLEAMPGVNHLIFRVQYPGMPQEYVLRAIRLLAEQVRPHLRPVPAG